MNTTLWTALALTASLAAPTLPVPSAPDATDDLHELLDSIGTAAVRDGELSRISVVIDVGGETLFAGAWGLRATPDASYPAAGMAEAFVASAALRLVDAGLLDLDDPLAKHLERPAYDEPVLVRHLLSHTSGVPSCRDLVETRRAVGRETTLADVLAWLEEAPLDASPGECYTPNETNTLLLGLIVEELTRRPLLAALETAVFEAAGMADTRPCDGEAGADPVAPLANLCTTAPDLVRWQRAIADLDLFSARTRALMTTRARLLDGTPIRAGLGLAYAPLDRVPGWTAGTSGTYVARYPERDLTVVVLAEGGEPAEPAEIGRRLARATLDLRQVDVLDLALDTEERTVYVGSYFIGCSEYLVLDDGERLRVHPPVGPDWTLLAQGHDVFLCATDADVVLTFEVANGRASSFALEEHGSRSIARRME